MLKSTLGIFAIVLLFVSCKKDEDTEICVKCTQTTTTTVTPDQFGLSDKTESTLEFCGVKAQIEAYEKGGTTTATSTSDGITVKVASVVKCNKQ